MPSTAPSSPTSPLDGLLPPDLSDTERRRGRLLAASALLALAGYAAAVTPLVHLGRMGSLAGVAVSALVTFLTLVGLRRGAWLPSAAAWVVFPALTLTILGVSWANMGLAAPELAWLCVVPVMAALVGDRRLAVVCAVGMALGVGLMWVRGTFAPFPQSSPSALVAIVAVVSLIGAGAVGAWLARLHESATEAALAEQRARLAELTAALRASEARYRTALDNVPVGVMRTSLDGEIQLANPAFARILGYPSLEAMRESGALATDFYADPDDRQRLVEAIADGGLHVVEVDGHSADGRAIRLRVHARARRSPSGSPLGIEGILEDITAEHEVRRQLETREARFRALVQHASDVVCVLDREARLTYASPSIKTALGVDPEGVLGAPIYDLLHPEDAERALTAFYAPHLAEGETATGKEFRLRHVDGHFLFAETIATPLFEDPAVAGLVVNFREVTDRKRAEAVLVHAKEQAEEVARLKSTFLANMSHEIRTPLTGILGFADILSDEVTDPEQKEFVDLILQSGRRLLDTLNSVLDLAKLDAGRMELTAEPIALAEAARESAKLLAPLAAEKGLVLSAEVRDEGARAEADAGALHRILTNLVGNAIKFTDEGSVTIVVRGTGSQVMLDVCDTGVGIEPEFLPHLFEEFQQESSGARRSHEGSGLGLAITRQLAERMGGTVAVESDKGTGSTFTVTFPRAEAAPVPGEARPPRVLVVDDNQQTRAMAARMLEAAYRVETAHGPFDAEELAAEAAETDDPFDIILLDINLGTMDTGEDVMRRLRLLAPYDARPIIAFTAYALPGDRERFLANGFDGYFAKPFTRDTLLRAVADGIGDLTEPPSPGAPAMIVRNPAPRATSRAGNRVVVVPGAD